mmetsp:Transcript_16577/g.40828  ORF Transcript_16577/g.40828 Transcript_16577/m.40828 type:complete len:540 (+) Transcript_16577:263-1882(+)|eukprot:CAMPEP_0114538070 /NCGR_PEP_ID=MMETSP0109-20121206/29934_1 /TAXON_ID=29199 /ORGANISM="Chlorarachnion reptans, Strain CCCM449" /LENGTH=539 /DNA_ID=CAMNT_0001722039 /DNA_START=194 /DNA_END=1813 /DNA_ORIENTATION=+
MEQRHTPADQPQQSPRAKSRMRRQSATATAQRWPLNAGAYKLDGELGCGSFGTCHRARRMAIKWNRFFEVAEDAKIKPESIAALVDSGFRDRPDQFFEHESEELRKVLGKHEDDISGVLKAIEDAKTLTSQEVAVKIMPNDSYNFSKMRDELASLRSFSHKNLVSVHCAFTNKVEEDEELWIVMPLQFASMDQVLKISDYKNGIKDPRLLATILHQLLEGLEYVHKDMRMHRDIKAANLLLSREGEIKLADFGEATPCEKGHGSTFAGSPAWMAPEVIAKDREANTKADIWSFGITALELAYGCPPYGKMHALQALHTILKSPPPTAEGSYKDFSNHLKLPASFHRMVARCLKKNPLERPTARMLKTHAFFKNNRDCKYVEENLVPKIPEKEKLESNKAPAIRKRARRTSLPIETFILPTPVSKGSTTKKSIGTASKLMSTLCVSPVSAREPEPCSPARSPMGSEKRSHVRGRRVGRFTLIHREPNRVSGSSGDASCEEESDKGEKGGDPNDKNVMKRGRFTVTHSKTLSTEKHFQGNR